jgi:hypothetical protein
MSRLFAVAPPPPDKARGSTELFVAELQAELLLEWAQVLEPPVPNWLLETFPGVEVLWATEPRLGVAMDPREGWRLIVVGADADTPGRQRFALAYGLKRLLDVPRRRRRYEVLVGEVRPEATAAYRFAASLLMPRRLFQCAWKASAGREVEMAKLFGVEQVHIRARRTQLGIA